MHGKIERPKTLHIGELSRRTGRTVHTIRWYETQGLVPGVTRDPGGRRVYKEHHVGWLDLMERLRYTGMSIAQMREYTGLVKQGSATLKQRRILLAAHETRMRETVARWSEAMTLIRAKIDFYDEWIINGIRPAVEPYLRVRKAKSISRTALRP